MKPHFAALDEHLDKRFDSVNDRLTKMEKMSKTNVDAAKKNAKEIENTKKALKKQEQQLNRLDKAFRKFHRRDHNEYVH